MPPRAGTIEVISPQEISARSPNALPLPQNAYVNTYGQELERRFDNSGQFWAPQSYSWGLEYGPAPLRISKIWNDGLSMMSTLRYVGFPRANSGLRLSPPPIILPGRGLGGISMYTGKHSDNLSRIPGVFVDWPSFN